MSSRTTAAQSSTRKSTPPPSPVSAVAQHELASGSSSVVRATLAHQCPGKVSKGVQKLREKEAGGWMRIVLSKGSNGDRVSISTMDPPQPWQAHRCGWQTSRGHRQHRFPHVSSRVAAYHRDRVLRPKHVAFGLPAEHFFSVVVWGD